MRYIINYTNIISYDYKDTVKLTIIEKANNDFYRNKSLNFL